MTKVKCLIILTFIAILSLILPNISNAETEQGIKVTRNVYSNNGSMKFNFTGLTLDITHEYEYGFAQTAATEVGNWYLITEYTQSTATVDMITTNGQMGEVFNKTDTRIYYHKR